MFTESVRAAGPYFQFKYGPPARTSSSDGSGSHQVQSVIFVVVITGYRAAFCVVGTRPCRGRSGLAAAKLALLLCWWHQSNSKFADAFVCNSNSRLRPSIFGTMR